MSGRPHGLVLSGVAGQDVLTLAQILLDALRRSGFHALPAEIPGLDQGLGSVGSLVWFSEAPFSLPIIEEGQADLLIALEPFEALRHVALLRMNGHLVVSEEPRLDRGAYPPLDDVYAALKQVRGVHLVDTEDLARRLDHPQAGDLALLGLASRFLPVPEALWPDVIGQRCAAEGNRIAEKHLEAFRAGRGLVREPVVA
jgi:Pyruvate/2-oxoacid:ferredoxin oxidoreductase gamma subunit